jgi:anthranilate phosphoribosyltransferase
MPFLIPLHKVLNRRDLSVEEARAAMDLILSGEVSTPRLAAFLAALKVKGETAAEIEGFARSMRAGCVRVEHGVTDRPVVDIVGTGGDGHGSINVSTVASFVISAAGYTVAKHGNRSISSKSGAADVLEALGVRLDLAPARVAASIREVGIGFLFAPLLHPAMKYAMPARLELKARTVFNLLGPLTSPAGATVQVIGAPSAELTRLMAEALVGLGLRHGFVIYGSDGLDEVTLSGPTTAYEINGAELIEHTYTPADFGLASAPLEALLGGDKHANAARARAILQGERGAQRDFIVANAALGIYAAASAAHAPLASVAAAARMAERTIDSGAAWARLEAFREFTQR